MRKNITLITVKVLILCVVLALLFSVGYMFSNKVVLSNFISNVLTLFTLNLIAILLILLPANFLIYIYGKQKKLTLQIYLSIIFTLVISNYFGFCFTGIISIALFVSLMYNFGFTVLLLFLESILFSLGWNYIIEGKINP
jgi:hypothetical protein